MLLGAGGCFGARDGFTGEEGAGSGETQPPTGPWVPWHQQQALLTPTGWVLQPENAAQLILVELLLTSMGYQWLAFILDVFKHRREDSSTLAIVSQPRRTTLEFHARIWEDCMACRGLAMSPATPQYVGNWLQCIPYQNTRGRHFKTYLQKAHLYLYG